MYVIRVKFEDLPFAIRKVKFAYSPAIDYICPDGQKNFGTCSKIASRPCILPACSVYLQFFCIEQKLWLRINLHFLIAFRLRLYSLLHQLHIYWQSNLQSVFGTVVSLLHHLTNWKWDMHQGILYSSWLQDSSRCLPRQRMLQWLSILWAQCVRHSPFSSYTLLLSTLEEEFMTTLEKQFNSYCYLHNN